LDAGLTIVERHEQYRISTDLIPEEMKRRGVQDNVGLTQERTQQIRAKYLVAAGRLAEARGLVEQEISKMDEARPGQLPSGDEWRRAAGRRVWVQQLGAIAEKEGRVEAALSLYRSVLGGLPPEALKNAGNPNVAPMKKLYLANGGSEDKWIEWATSGAPPREGPRERRAPQFSEKVPEFSARDLTGKTWLLKDLQGKATFVNYWATWCGPCRAEHPEVQKLHNLAKDRDDMQVLTISVDHNPDAVAAYIKEKGYTFATIHDPALADQILPYMGLPTNFLVNAAGMRTSFYGFWGGEQNLQTTVADLEQAAQE
jgi:thiol-disulfide isomerase/thioredoxin